MINLNTAILLSTAAGIIQNATQKRSNLLAHIFHDHIETFDAATASHVHPVVANSQAYCSRSVDRLKRGPVDIPEKICDATPYTDTEFEGADQVYWSDYNTGYSSMQNYINNDYITFNRWPS